MVKHDPDIIAMTKAINSMKPFAAQIAEALKELAASQTQLVELMKEKYGAPGEHAAGGEGTDPLP